MEYLRHAYSNIWFSVALKVESTKEPAPLFTTSGHPILGEVLREVRREAHSHTSCSYSI
jgi:hypothetical protein